MEKDLQLISLILSRIQVNNSKASKLSDDYGIDLDQFEVDILDEVLSYIGVPEDSSCEFSEYDDEFFCRDWYYFTIQDIGASESAVYDWLLSIKNYFSNEKE